MSRYLWEKTNGHCAYCGVAFVNAREMTVDHLVPKSRGGSENRSNKFPCCARCNRRKRDRPLSYLRNVLQREKYGRPHFSQEQIAYLASHNIALPLEEPYQFYWEVLGNAFEGGIDE